MQRADPDGLITFLRFISWMNGSLCPEFDSSSRFSKLHERRMSRFNLRVEDRHPTSNLLLKSLIIAVLLEGSGKSGHNFGDYSPDCRIQSIATEVFKTQQDSVEGIDRGYERPSLVGPT